MKRKNHLPKLALGLSIMLGMNGFAQADVVTSIKPLGFIAAAIADGVTPVTVVLPDGASEHDYALRPSDVRRIKNADLLVWVGPEMESFITRSASQLAANKNLELSALPVIQSHLVGKVEDDHDHSSSPTNTLQSVKSSDGEMSDSHSHRGTYNLHIWLSPDIALMSATAIHDRLVQSMPAQKTKLDSNLSKFKASLKDADEHIRQQLNAVKDKRYYVFHDAYTYFEQHYGLSPLGYFTVNPEIQPGAQKLNEIRTQLTEHKAQCVFAEPQFRPAVIDAVSRGTKVQKGTLDPLGSNISLSQDSYVKFLSQLSSQYVSCLKPMN
ncbi:zinc ABC transporter substrate-binding protein ZnuA [Rosenbergiella nectarea]|uniref:zinc ABC transporter substrate-binding protein ZnuA n=1 Tax=Rosenbergiella nectarea TaxID=988801 RepID=UPI001BD9B322|nr:zinc ABC transporter substrate-binding protein ZnuA [Rosenbergiella nectarea]MBT0729436.1 zinc ABC transporter substrate-binding protein ZnuA [Rosenbergiella nectarea subsp. apis]